MDRNQPITTYRCELLNLLKKARVSQEVRWVNDAGEKRKR